MQTNEQPIFPKPKFSLAEFLSNPEPAYNTKDWQETPRYWNRCCVCGEHFQGSKQRSTCKECYGKI